MAKRKLPVRPTRRELQDAVKASFDRTLIEADSLREREQWLNLSAAIHLIAHSSDSDLRKLVREAVEIGFADQNLEDARQAAVRLARWQTLLQAARSSRRSARDSLKT